MEKHLQANIIIANNNGLCLTFDRTAKSLRGKMDNQYWRVSMSSVYFGAARGLNRCRWG